MSKMAILVFWMFLLTNGIKGEIYSSTESLIKLVEVESLAIHHLQKCTDEYDIEKTKFLPIIDEMQSAQNFIRLSNILKYVGHPINAYSIVKRWTILMQQYQSCYKYILQQQYLNNLSVINDDDLSGSLAAIVRLQRVYELKTTELSKGIIYGHTAVHPLHAEDLISIGKTAFAMEDYNIALEWFLETAKTNCSKVSQPLVYAEIAKSYIAMNKLNKAFLYAEKAYHLAPGDSEVVNLYGLLEFQVEQLDHNKNNVVNSNNIWLKNITKLEKIYEELCRGYTKISKKRKYSKNLYCSNKATLIPYVTYKEEILYQNPKVVLYHEVITNKEQSMIIHKAYPSLKMAKIRIDSGQTITNRRVSKVTWLWDREEQWIKHLTQRISFITGLNTEYRSQITSAEPFQVINYGIGGQYEPHHDYLAHLVKPDDLSPFLQGAGDRLATFLIYLNDVQYGGATVFPKLHLRIPPVKNGAVFWYNFKRSGQKEEKSLHAGCPVLLGQKWVSNKWIRQVNQAFTRKCGLTPDAVDL